MSLEPKAEVANRSAEQDETLPENGKLEPEEEKKEETSPAPIQGTVPIQSTKLLPGPVINEMLF